MEFTYVRCDVQRMQIGARATVEGGTEGLARGPSTALIHGGGGYTIRPPPPKAAGRVPAVRRREGPRLHKPVSVSWIPPGLRGRACALRRWWAPHRA